MAPLVSTDKGRDQEYVFSKKTETPSLISTIPVKEVTFVNTALNPGNVNFAPIEKTAQQLREEQIEQKMKKEPEIAVKGSKGGWLGSKTTEEKPPQAEFKVSAWALKAQEGQVQPTGNFAPLQKSAQEQKLDNVYSRKEQEFKFSSKKEQEERRKAREQQELAIKK